MKSQSNVSPPKPHNNLKTEFKDNETEFRSLLLKMIRDLKENSNKQLNKVRKSNPRSGQESQEYG
jgi:hypothetical protein